MKRVLKTSLRIVGGFFAFVLFYLFCALLLSVIPVEKEQSNSKPIVPIYLLSNGVHTDLVLPYRSAQKDWSEDFPIEDTQSKDSTRAWLAVGWGDKGFYLDTKTWADLTAKTGFNALVGLGGSTLHITHYRSLQESTHCVGIKLTEAQYARLVSYIENTAEKANSKNILIPKASYGVHDAFYEAEGVYNLFQTCNSWANAGLKTCGQKACLWTPFDKGIFYHYSTKSALEKT